MSEYYESLLEHLSLYKRDRLGTTEKGEFRGKLYEHILPKPLQHLNLLESIRSEFQQYLRDHPGTKLHKYYHHLNSSQAFAFNLFYPYFLEGGECARSLSLALGVDVYVSDWFFEFIPDSNEGTNVDVAWTATDGSTTFCEVKLSEKKFGSAKNDPEHREKLEAIYRPRLTGMVNQKLLEEDVFFKHYQLLRNISLLYKTPQDHLIFLLPKANNALHPQLETVLTNTLPGTRERIKVAYVENCMESMSICTTLPPSLDRYAFALEEKYLPQ